MTKSDKHFKMVVFLVIFFAILLPVSLMSQEESKEKETTDKTEKQKKIDRLFKMSLEELMDVRITTAGKTSQRIGDIPASVVLITREDIETFGYRTLPEILENIPGLFGINDYGENGFNFGVRGFWSTVANDNMIILVNNVHQANDFDANYPLDRILVPVEAIDRIEIIRGPMSVVYGNGAFFGVINIITNEASEKPVSLISGSLGTSKTSKVFVRVSGGEGDFNYVFNSSLSDTYGVDEPLDKMISNTSSLPSLGITPEQGNDNTGGRLEVNEKYFNFSGTFQSFFVNMNYNEGKRETYFGLPPIKDGSFDRTTKTYLSFGFRKEFTKSLTLEGKFTYQKIRDSYRYDHLFEGFFGIQQLDTNAWESEFNAFIKSSDHLDITVGLYYRSIMDASNFWDLPSFGASFAENTTQSLVDNDDIVTRALFAQVDYAPTKKLKLVAGIRFEQSPKYELQSFQAVGTNPPVEKREVYDREEIEIIPRFAAIYSIDDHNIFKLLYGKAINRPSFFQNTLNSLDFSKQDLQPLDPESIETVELNFISSLSSHFSLNFSVFRNVLNNLITRIVQFQDNNEFLTWSDNAGKMITHGTELTISTEPIEYLRLELSGTYQKTTDKRLTHDGIDVAYSPNFLGYFKTSYLGVGFKVALTGTYVGDMHTFWDETGADGKGSRIGDDVKGYFVLGANLRFDDLFMDGIFLNIRCSNLLNQEIRYPTTTLTDIFDKGTIGIKRTFLVSLGFKF